MCPVGFDGSRHVLVYWILLEMCEIWDSGLGEFITVMWAYGMLQITGPLVNWS